MALRIAGWASGKPRWHSGSKDESPGSQDGGPGRKIRAREAKKTAGKGRWASGIAKSRLSRKVSRSGSSQRVRESCAGAGRAKKRSGSGKKTAGTAKTDKDWFEGRRGRRWSQGTAQSPGAQRSAEARSSVPKSSTSTWRTSLSLVGPRTPTRSLSRLRSTVRNCETFTTLGRESPASPRRRRTFPGMAASRRFEVTAATTIVEMALRLNRSCWTTRAGRRPAGSEPSGAPKWSQYTSPWRITSARSSNPFRPCPDLSRHGSAPGPSLHRRRARSNAS